WLARNLRAETTKVSISGTVQICACRRTHGTRKIRMPSFTSNPGRSAYRMVTTETACPRATQALAISQATGDPPPPTGGNSWFSTRILWWPGRADLNVDPSASDLTAASTTGAGAACLGAERRGARGAAELALDALPMAQS